MPAGTIADRTKVAQQTVIDTHLNLGTGIALFVGGLANGTLIHDISITKLTYGNNFMAVILYETP